MRLIGDFKIIPGKSVAITDGNATLKPYLFLHPLLKDFNGSTPVILAPGSIESSHILNSLCPTEDDDGMFLWFCIASHPRCRVQRHLCHNAIILNSGEWGSAVIAIARDDIPSEIVFHKGLTTETARLECGVVVRTNVQRDCI